MITAIFGDLSRSRWALDLPGLLTISHTTKDQLGKREIKTPGPHDLMALAAALHGAPGKRRDMPVWDYTWQKTGTPLSEAEAETLRPETLDCIGEIKQQTRLPLVVAIDDIQDWVRMMVLAFQHPDPVIQLHIREQKITDTLLWLSRTIPVLLIAARRPTYRDGSIVGYEPDIDNAIERLINLAVEVVHGEGRIAQSRSSMPVGKLVKPEDLLETMQLPSLRRGVT